MQGSPTPQPVKVSFSPRSALQDRRDYSPRFLRQCILPFTMTLIGGPATSPDPSGSKGTSACRFRPGRLFIQAPETLCISDTHPLHTLLDTCTVELSRSRKKKTHRAEQTSVGSFQEIHSLLTTCTASVSSVSHPHALRRNLKPPSFQDKPCRDIYLPFVYHHQSFTDSKFSS